MSGLFQSLNIGSQSLYANRQGIDTTAHNISNAQTEGYSRQRVKITQRDPREKHNLLIGNGAYVGSVDRMHSKFIARQLNHANAEVGDSEVRFSSLGQLGEIYSPELGNSVASDVNDFFASWQNLAKFPEEMTVRTQVREQGQNLAETFKRVDLDLRRQRQGFNEHIEKTGEEVTGILANIAHLNDQIRQNEVGLKNQANDLRDQRDRSLVDLSKLIDVNYYEDSDGMLTIHGPAEVLLVDRGRASRLEMRQNGANNGMFDILTIDSEGSSCRNITKHIEAGRLHGLLEVRDKVADSLIKSNHSMAATLVKEVNDLHSQGFGVGEFRESSGRDFFNVKSGAHDLAAQNMQVSLEIINSTDAISAASVKNAIGDNIVANDLAGLQSAKVFSEHDASFNEFYADYVGVLGMETVRVQRIGDADNIILADIESRRESVSGVSLDEEATNLIRWQTAFTASSKVITTIDEMFQTVLDLKR